MSEFKRFSPPTPFELLIDADLPARAARVTAPPALHARVEERAADWLRGRANRRPRVANDVSEAGRGMSLYLVERFPCEQRHEGAERTMAIGTSYASACGLALRLIDIIGGEWLWDSYRALWEELRPDGWALRVRRMMAADQLPEARRARPISLADEEPTYGGYHDGDPCPACGVPLLITDLPAGVLVMCKCDGKVVGDPEASQCRQT
jgi:hypothetical protein